MHASFHRGRIKSGNQAWRGLWLLAALLLVAAPGCESRQGQSSEANAAAGTFRVITTCGMVTDIVRQVVGERGTVTGLMGEGVDPHLYKPTSHDVRELQSADIVFFSGLMLEGRMETAFDQVREQGKPVHAVTEKLDPETLRLPAEFEGHPDPHVWMDVSLWSECVQHVSDCLADFDPQGAETYRANAASYREQLASLHDYAQRKIGSIPSASRVLVTAHDAFGYFSRAYDIPVLSAQGISTESEAGVRDINELVDAIVEKQVRAIFFESSVNPKNLQAVIEGAQQKGWQVIEGGELFSDAMGAPGTYEGTYFGMIDHNVTTITRQLGGEAPAEGLQGKLATAESQADL